MKDAISIVFGLFLACIFIGTISGQEAATKAEQQVKEPVTERQTQEPEAEQQASSQQQAEAGEVNVSDFYKNLGFQLIPSSRTFAWKNRLKNSLYYNSNVFLTDGKEESSTVYVADFLSAIDISTGRLGIGVEGGFRYEKYFDASDLDELFPRAKLSLKYKTDIFYCTFSNTITRNGVVNSLELKNVRASWVSNQLIGTVGVRYDRYMAEISIAHTYTDYRSIQGDYFIVEPTIRVGHEFTETIDITVEYMLDQIDYREAATIATALPRRQIDTIGHTVMAGMSVKFFETLEGYIRAGAQMRESDIYFASRVNLIWTPRPRWKIELQSSYQTMSSFIADFQIVTSAVLNIEYSITEDLAVDAGMLVVHINPSLGDTFIGYYPHVIFTYRVYRGIEADVFYKGSSRKSDQPDSDYDQHSVGGSLTLIF